MPTTPTNNREETSRSEHRRIGLLPRGNSHEGGGHWLPWPLGIAEPYGARRGVGEILSSVSLSASLDSLLGPCLRVAAHPVAISVEVEGVVAHDAHGSRVLGAVAFAALAVVVRGVGVEAPPPS